MPGKSKRKKEGDYLEVVTLQEVKGDKRVKSYLQQAGDNLAALGYTEHGFRHAELVAEVARKILQKLNYSSREQELAAISGYLHDMGNAINRVTHDTCSAILGERILFDLGMASEEIAEIVAAVGNHDENGGFPVSSISGALIIADKSDVHRSRVRNPDISSFDIHDRVNYAVQRSFVKVNEDAHTITLQLTVDTSISPVMDYFEIFLARMVMCRRAAEFLHCAFELSINDVRLL